MVVTSPFVNMSPKNKCHGWMSDCDLFVCALVLWSLQHFRSFNLLSAHASISAQWVLYELFTQIHSLDEKQCSSRSAGFMRSQLIWINTISGSKLYSKEDFRVFKKLHAQCTLGVLLIVHSDS